MEPSFLKMYTLTKNIKTPIINITDLPYFPYRKQKSWQVLFNIPMVTTKVSFFWSAMTIISSIQALFLYIFGLADHPQKVLDSLQSPRVSYIWEHLWRRRIIWKRKVLTAILTVHILLLLSLQL